MPIFFVWSEFFYQISFFLFSQLAENISWKGVHPMNETQIFCIDDLVWNVRHDAGSSSVTLIGSNIIVFSIGWSKSILANTLWAKNVNSSI